MQNPKPADPYADPHDDVLVARIDEELSSLAPDARPDPWDPQPQIAPDFYAGAAVPPVDTTFRAAAVNNGRGRRPSIGRRAARAVTAFLLAACIGAAAVASHSYGTVAKQMVGKWVPKFLLTTSLPLESTGLPEQPSPPAVQANAAQATPPQPAAQTATESVVPAAAGPSSDQAQLLQSMARDLAAARQEIDQLKASQEQMSRDIARVSEAKAKAAETRAAEIKSSETKSSEQNLRPRISALPPRSVASPARRPTPSYSPPQAAYPAPQATAATPLPPPAAAYVPRQPEPPPQATPYPQADPELSPPRPPMPVR